jgi:hypothetical protein
MADNLISMQHSTKESASFSIGGESFNSDDSGIIRVPSHLSEHAKAHGFAAVAEKGPKKLEPLAKASGAKGVADDTIGDSSGQITDGEPVKTAQKGAKASGAKGGAE